MKIIPLAMGDEDNMKELENELNLLVTMDHPHVLKIHEWFPSEGNLCIVSELCSGGSLFGYATTLQLSENLCFF